MPPWRVKLPSAGRFREYRSFPGSTQMATCAYLYVCLFSVMRKQPWLDAMRVITDTAHLSGNERGA